MRLYQLIVTQLCKFTKLFMFDYYLQNNCDFSNDIASNHLTFFFNYLKYLLYCLIIVTLF